MSTSTPFKWPGGKARFAKEVSMMLASHLPRYGYYYEGFGGAMSVAAELGNLRPDAEIVITETNPYVVSAMRAIRDEDPVKLADQVIIQMADLRGDHLFREARLQKYCKSLVPADFLAGMNCRYNGNLKNHNWNGDKKSVRGRLPIIREAIAFYHEGLRNATICENPCSVRELADVAFFDPPYFDCTNMYPHQEGDDVSWAKAIRRQMGYSKYILVSNFDIAAPLYEPMGFKMTRLKKALMWKQEGRNDTYFEWSRR